MDLLQRIYVGRRAELKRQILQSALDCFIEYGLEATTIEMIRERANASVGAIYHHFKHKEGMITALYLAALTDQANQRLEALAQSQSIEQGIHAVILSYLTWVEQYPNFSRFLYASHFSIQQKAELKTANQQRNLQLLQWLEQQPDQAKIAIIPSELLLSLVIGPTESYCRAWLSGRVKSSPRHYATALAQSAWDSLQHFQA
ncbi:MULTISPECIES: TetR/AcrR family transcriptional regulator [Acinetobacter]|uniref:TetR/AcrR family transcriptional regulator n=1 Tax=Acinetobacter TaxID=469 RepID=UPI0014449C36|nr:MULTISPECIES: TetR/AcrR family transcriptional regulator [Acinetobacter]MDM1278004.1 TetR/AcrR family transcriptional regulator [Acinetobacter indicus]QSQ94546.1 TetR/AcrR family transcriptional regulator [Acinetobacter indicus]